MESGLKEKWDRRHGAACGHAPVAAVLRENAHLLPAAGDALDLACGLGGNALFLAARGMRTQAWDLSPVAIERLRALARKRGLSLRAVVRDVIARPPEPACFDVIVVSRFLERTLAPALVEALRPGGLLFYQTFTRSRVDDGGPRNPEYRLRPNELLQMFKVLRLVHYREEGPLANAIDETRNMAMFIGRRLPGTEPVSIPLATEDAEDQLIFSS